MTTQKIARVASKARSRSRLRVSQKVCGLFFRGGDLKRDEETPPLCQFVEPWISQGQPDNGQACASQGRMVGSEDTLGAAHPCLLFFEAMSRPEAYSFVSQTVASPPPPRLGIADLRCSTGKCQEGGVDRVLQLGQHLRS